MYSNFYIGVVLSLKYFDLTKTDIPLHLLEKLQNHLYNNSKKDIIESLRFVGPLPIK